MRFLHVFFSELVIYHSPQHSILSDEEQSITTLGQGLIDIIINNKYRIQQKSQLTDNTPTALLATRDHTRYKGCDVTSEHGNLRACTIAFRISRG